MKKLTALLMALLMVLSVTAYAEEAQTARTIASYAYALSEGAAEYVENLIFNEDVIISGSDAQIIFVNCEFNGDVILTADTATRVLLLGCDVNGVCVLQNNVKEATIDYPLPKFMCDSPVTVVCEDCVGSVIPLGDFEVVFNGETYTMADSQFFNDVTNHEAGLVPYEGQEAHYFCIAQWWENDQQTLLVLCEYDPDA